MVESNEVSLVRREEQAVRGTEKRPGRKQCKVKLEKW